MEKEEQETPKPQEGELGPPEPQATQLDVFF